MVALPDVPLCTHALTVALIIAGQFSALVLVMFNALVAVGPAPLRAAVQMVIDLMR